MKKRTIITQIVFITIIALSLIFFSLHKVTPSKVLTDILNTNPFCMRLISPSENADTYIRSQMDICFKNGRDDCYKQVSSLFMGQFDYTKVLSLFQSTEQYPEIFSRCHEVTHFIGQDAYKSDPSVSDLYAHGSSVCWGGFYHGVIEGYFAAKNLDPFDPNNSELVSQIQNVCGQKADYKTPRFFYECLHGIGHAMMFITVSNLPASLKWCDKLPGKDEQTTCYGGVFMENSSSSTSIDHPSKYIKADDPLYPCDSLDSKYLNMCYQYQSSYFAQIVKYDWTKNAALCADVPKPYQSGCFTFIGSNQVGNTQSMPSMYAVCNAIQDPAAQNSCITGVVSGLSGRFVSQPEKIIEFCDLVKLTLAKTCWSGLGVAASSWNSDKTVAAGICKMEDSQKTQWCLTGLGGSYSNVINK